MNINIEVKAPQSAIIKSQYDYKLSVSKVYEIIREF